MKIMKKGFSYSFILFLLIITLSSCTQEPIKKPVELVRVIDGDTIIVEVDGKEETVRLIGVDTPESVHPDDSKNVPYGKIATEFTESAMKDKTITIELDASERDKYGRLLAYVYLDEEMLNKELLKNGHAKVATFPPNVKYVEEFQKIEQEAKENNIGLWQ